MGLRQKKTGIVGIVVSDISIPFYAEFVKKVEEILSPFNYGLIMGSSFYNPEKELKILEGMRAKRVDGIIIFPEANTVKEINKIIKSGIPLVAVERKIPKLSTNGVYVDNEKATYDAVQYLIDNGHRVIAFIDRFVDKSHSVDRRNGFLKALEKNNLSLKDGLIIRGGFSFEEGYKNAKDILEKLPEVTAIITFGDISAVGVIKALNENGLKVPEDVSVFGHIDMDISNFVIPRLSTIRYPIREMAESATEILFDRLGKNKMDLPLKEIVLPLKLIIRESTGKANTTRIRKTYNLRIKNSEIIKTF